MINEKRRQQRELLEHERLVEKQYQKEMMMYQRGLSDDVPDSLKKRLGAVQKTLQEEGVIDSDDKTLEFRAIVKGTFIFIYKYQKKNKGKKRKQIIKKNLFIYFYLLICK